MAATEAEIDEYKEKIYEECLKDMDKIYYQYDFEDMHILPNGDQAIVILAQIIQALSDEKCLYMLRDQNGTCYKVRHPEDAKIVRSLNADEQMVYSHIEGAGSNGIWTKIIKGQSRLHDSAFAKAMGSLMKRKIIKEIKDMEHPARKTYILYNIVPSVKTTGGAWFTDNEIDEELIKNLSDLLSARIQNRTFQKPSGHNLKRNLKHIDAIRALGEKAFASSGAPIEVEDDTPVGKTIRVNEATYPFPTVHNNYPNLEELTLWILESRVANFTLTAEDIQQLLDVMCWDGLIEKVNGNNGGIAYKAIRKSNEDLEGSGPQNGFTEAPCGRCPVFDLCEEGGPVSPSNCVYYTEWLNF